MEFFNNLMPVFVSALFCLIGYLVKMLLDLSHRVLALEVKIEEILRLLNDKRNT